MAERRQSTLWQPGRPLHRLLGIVALLAASLVASAQDLTLTIATVDNGDMLRMQRLARHFTAANPGIALQWVTLDETVLRQRVTTDIATGGGRFDIVTIGTFEAPIWAERGWLVPLAELPAAYDVDDLLPPIRAGLSHHGTLHALPFYAESAFTMYRTDLFAQAGLQMPDSPTWGFIRDAAAAIDAMHSDVHGICLRGKPGWGENMAILTAMANAYGGRWFDMDWSPQLDSDAWAAALADYVALLREYGPADAAGNGFTESLALFQSGRCAIWVDATVAGAQITDPRQSQVADQVGFALAPDTGLGKRSNWLWAWALAIPTSSRQQDAARRFITWATSRDYTELMAREDGWAAVPPGTRMSLYRNPAYLDAAPFAATTLASIQAADPHAPAVNPVPYRGIQYVDIPEFPGIGSAVGQRFALALTGEITVQEALENAQWVTGKVIRRARRVRDDQAPSKGNAADR